MRKIIVSLFILFTASGLIIAEKSTDTIHNLETLLDAMELKENEIRTISFSFNQELEITYSGETQAVSGKAYFKKPDNIRIENNKPEKNIFITNGETAWFYAPSQKQVMVGAWKDISSQSGNFFKGILNLTDNIRDLNDRYKLLYEGQDRSFYKLALLPHEETRDAYTMKLWIHKDDMLPHKTTLIMSNMIMRTTIHKIKVDKTISNKKFIFSTPSGVEEIPFPF